MASRRGIALAATCAALALAGCGGGSGSDAVIFADYGGTTRLARAEAFLGPFSEANGVRSISADADPAKLELFAEQKRAEWDLIDMDGWDVDRFSRAGLLEKLPRSVPRVDLVPKRYREYASGGYSASVGFGYRTGDGPAPQTWADFFDTERFPGKRALPNFAYFQAESALLADGVPCGRLYPLDLRRAFAKLDAIRDDLLFYDSFGQGLQYLAQGSVSMALLPNSRVAVLQDEDLPIDYSWNQAFFQWTAPAVPKFAPHADAAFELVRSMAQPEAQAEFARLTKYGPANSKALELLDAETRAQLPTAHLDVACKVDDAGLSRNLDEYSGRFQEWLAKG